MSKTINDIIDGLSAALATAPEIIAWVNEHYEVNVTDETAGYTVCVAVDPEHPPVPNPAPVIEVAQGKRKRNLDRNCIRHQVLVGAWVRCELLSEVGRIRKRMGGEWANKLAAMCEAVCIEWFRNNNILWQPSDDSVPDSSMGSVFRAVWVFDVFVRDRITY